ncbi:hypothetical protein ABD76_09895 [Paenibacillus dendritiformis]|nr:hypothetical protein [Paenibacillus dendritiformis]
MRRAAAIIGTSHADGFFRDSEISLPISHCICRQQQGECVHLEQRCQEPDPASIRMMSSLSRIPGK